MIGEKIAFFRVRRGVAEVEAPVIRIPKVDFEARGREVGVLTFADFYQSDAFRADFTKTETEILREL
jgi:hypothetical protein